jgi:hypothetical protein
VVIVAATLACGGGGSARTAPPGAKATSSIAVTSTMAVEVSAEAEVEAAYLRYWAVVDRLVQSPDGDDAELAARAVDPVLAVVRDDLREYAARGTYVELPRTSRPHAIQRVEVTDGRATVIACQLDDAVVHRRDGSIVDDDVLTKRLEASLVHVDRTWKLSESRVVEQWSGDAGCDARSR